MIQDTIVSSLGTNMLNLLIDNDKVLSTRVIGTPLPDHPYRFQVVPRSQAHHLPGVQWYVVLKRMEDERIEIPLEIRGDVVIGLASPAGQPDVDLSQLGGYHHGVSRHHLLIRPTGSKLYAIDLKSTNGTCVNGYPLSPSQAFSLSSGDLLTLGHLFLGIEILSKPL